MIITAIIAVIITVLTQLLMAIKGDPQGEQPLFRQFGVGVSEVRILPEQRLLE